MPRQGDSPNSTGKERKQCDWRIKQIQLRSQAKLRCEDCRSTAPAKMQHSGQSSLGENRHVGKDDPPPFSKARPCLTLPPASDLSLNFPLEGYGNAGKVLAKGDNLKPGDGARQVGGGTGFAKGFNLVDAVKTFVRTKAGNIRGGPEHAHQRVYIVCDQRLFIARIKFAQLGHGGGVVDRHRGQNIFLVGSTHLGNAALTVIIGSLTTWLMRSFMTTLHSR